MPAVVARFHHNDPTLQDGSPNPDFLPDWPLLWVEFLVNEQGTPRFTPDRRKAHSFKFQYLAEERAVALRAAKFGHAWPIGVAREDEDPRPSSPPVEPPGSMRRTIRRQRSAPVALFGYKD